MAIYTVEPGDNLTKIAAKLSKQTGAALYGYVQALVNLNQLADPNKIYIGQSLTYPDEWTASPVRPVPPAPVAPVMPAKPPTPFWKNPVVIGSVFFVGLLFLMNRRS